ncbi:MAG TPA: hypothetical protein PKA39_15245, partial [Ignavibacteria bacterium]|nr:hypothetical protein [Ignavibacteria bacterium]
PRQTCSVVQAFLNFSLGIEFLKKLRHHPAKEIVKKIQNSAIEFCEGKPLHDDLTMIVIKR